MSNVRCPKCDVNWILTIPIINNKTIKCQMCKSEWLYKSIQDKK
jgi:predicted  nucleic acid-binding Zn ribbon protein